MFVSYLISCFRSSSFNTATSLDFLLPPLYDVAKGFNCKMVDLFVSVVEAGQIKSFLVYRANSALEPIGPFAWSSLGRNVVANSILVTRAGGLGDSTCTLKDRPSIGSLLNYP